MKLNVGQRRMYLLALIIILLAVALLCVWRLWLADGEGGETAGSATPAPEITFEPVSPTPGTGATLGVSGGVDTVVYYQDNFGYLVPVLTSVPYEDGIAKATLSLMVASGPNDMQAARLGLRTVIPENVTMDLDIEKGKARIDLSKEALELPDAGAEYNMIAAIVQTLTEFDTVDRVEFLFGGQKLEKLPHGTDVSGEFTRGDLNLEKQDASAQGKGEKLTLYFPGDSASVVVPVTRMVYSRADLDTAVLEMTKGPLSEVLDEAVPKGCGLIDVQVENGVAKLNFTKEFMQIVNNIDGGRLALKALVVTCTQFEGVDSVEIYVEGDKWDAGEGVLTAPTFSNVATEIESAAIQAQSDAIFEGE